MAPYFLRNLVPRREVRRESMPLMTVLASLTWLQWAHFLTGWLAWTCDAIDFFSTSLSVGSLQKQFNIKEASTITTSITLTLLLRTIGAVIFGAISDRYGRKWPLIVNLLLCSLFELGSGFANDFHTFLAVRSLFGIAMGGIWGLAAATALENLPVEVRGLASGVIQQGYALGYLIAAVINLYLVPRTSWRALFWTSAGVSAFTAFLRVLTPESAFFLRARDAERHRIAQDGAPRSSKTRIFLRHTKAMLKNHWKLIIYAALLMAGFTFLSHGSQDLYPTYLQTTKGFSARDATVATIIGNCAAVAGGVIGGMISQYIGRRLTIIISVVVAGCFIPLWILPSSFSGLAAGAFCIQFGIQSAWGPVPVFLAEISPPAFRATFPGVAYQLGSMISSASAQIEATGGEHLRTTIVVDGKSKDVPDYATVQGIFIGAVAAYLILLAFFGPEKHGTHFEMHKAAFEECAEQDQIDNNVGRLEVTGQGRRSGSVRIDEKDGV